MSTPQHPFIQLVTQMVHDHRNSDYSDGDAPVRIFVPGVFATGVEGMASAGDDGLIDFRPYIYADNPHYTYGEGLRDPFGNEPRTVGGVDDLPYHLHPDHIVAIRPADDLPPT